MEIAEALTPKQREPFRREATRFLVRERHLFKREREKQGSKRVM